MGYFLAIDVGGTKIATSIFKESEHIGTLTSYSDTKNAETMYDSMIRTINEVLAMHNVQKESIHKVGLMIPGQIDFENERALYQNNLPWENFDIGKRMRQDFPGAEFVLKHDVQSAAVGEWVAKRKPNGMFVYVTISTGLSASMIYEGNLLVGNGFIGEIGHMKDEHGRMLEKVASGSAMEREVQSEFQYASLTEAFTAFGRGDAEMDAYFSTKAATIAQNLYNVFTVIDPDFLVLGGGVINNQKDFYNLIVTHFEECACHPGQKDWKNRISNSTYEQMSGIYGLLE